MNARRPTNNIWKRPKWAPWNDANMQLATEAVCGKVTGFKRAVKQFGIPRSILQRRYKRVGDIAVAAKKGLGRFRPVLSPAMELEPVAYIKRMESRLFGFTRRNDYAEANGIQHNFYRRTGVAGKDWCHDFMARHSDEIPLRTPEPTSAVRTRAFNQGAVNAFFDLLETVQDAKRFTPDRVYNVDE